MTTNRVEIEPPEAGPGEDPLDNHASRQQSRQKKPEQCHERKQGVPKRMRPEGPRARGPAGSGREDKVLAGSFRDARPNQAGKEGEGSIGETDHGQDQMRGPIQQSGPSRGGRDVARHAKERKPTETDGEKRHQQQGDPERRKRVEGKKRRGRDPIESASGAAGGRHAEWNRDQERQEKRQRVELEGIGQGLEDALRNRAMILEGISQIESHDAADPGQELLRNRAVELIEMAHLLHRFPRHPAALSGQRQRTARGEVQKHKDDQNNAEKRGNGEQNAPGDVGGHGPEAGTRRIHQAAESGQKW
jgi:hypothetical protein